MTFRYPYRNVTDVKTANYTAGQFELVQYSSVGGSFTITMPNDTNGPVGQVGWSVEDGCVVGIKNTQFNQTPVTLDATPNAIEDGYGVIGSTANLDYEVSGVIYYYDKPNTTWRRLSVSRPQFAPESWQATSDVILGVNTPIPLTFNTNLFPAPVFFTPNGGALECIRRFTGYADMVGYFEFVATSNNEDGQVDVDIYAVAGTPQIGQGYGLVASQATPRAGTFYEQRYNLAIVIAEVGDIIGLRGNDTGGTMVKSVVAESGLNMRQI